MSRRTTKKLLAGIGLLAILTAGALAVHYSPWGEAAAQEQQGEQPPMPVPVVKIAPKPVQLWKEFSGRLVAVDYVEIRPQVSGIIEKVNFQDGQIVQAGDVLFNIDPRPYEAAVAAAKAEVAAAQEDTAYAQKEVERAEQLLKTGAISQAGYDERVNSARTNKSASSGANARLKAALVDLDHAAIKAPISGRIARPEITAGNLVSSANAPLLTSIVSDKEIYGDFEVDEQTYLTFVRGRAGQNVSDEMSVPVRLALPNDKKEYQGTIKSFDNKINPSTGTIRARAVFGNEDNALLPGMFANVKIGSATQDNLITVPEKAVLTDQSRKFVYVVDKGAATYREVKLGDTVNGERIIADGLKQGDQVIIDNLMKIRPGAKVQAMTPQELEAMKAQMAKQSQGAGPEGGQPSGDAPEAAPDEKKSDEHGKDAPAAAAQGAANSSAPAKE